ncbi:MAG: SPOR domain-containing protein [Burkholderiaceae bacterium]|nr:SPOR domain-containing protein [Burkholderiaceae bacterium]
MSTLSIASHRTLTFRKLQLAGASVACVLLLSGCAIWPKALTFWGNTEPAAADTSTQPAASAPSAAASAPMEPTPVVTSSPVMEPAKPEVAPMASLPPERAPAKPAGPMKMERGYYINVGLFAVPSNGSSAFHKLEKAGLPAYTELLETNVGKLTRVRVGGFPTKAKADAAAKKVRSLQLEAIVFRHK